MSSILDDIKMQYKFGGLAQRFIYWNVACFLVSIVFFYQFKIGVFEFPNWIALWSNPEIVLANPWTLLTYAFFHDGFGHIFFNMIVLNFACTLFLTFFTQKQLFGLYLLSAIFAGISFVGSCYILNSSFPIVGASAAIMAVLVATTTYQPLMNIRLLLIGNVKLWHITAAIIIVSDLMQIRDANMGGHIAHLAGAFFGFLYIKFLQNGFDLSKIVSEIIDFFAHLFVKKEKIPFKKVHRNYPTPTTKRASKIVKKDKQQQQIDEILDKISQSGYESLNKEEKEFLFKAGK